MRRSQGGFTLVEVMVVVAIVSILIGLAVVMVNPTPTPRDVSQRLSDMVREASREAINFGTIRANVSTTLSSKARACVVGSVNAAGQTVFTENLLVESATVASTAYTWISQQTYTVPKQITTIAFATSVGNYAGVTPLNVWSNFKLCCYPDGTCDPYSAFFQSTKSSGGPNYQARISVLPLGAMPVIRSDFTSL